MPETPQQYISRILGNVEGKDPLKVQSTTAVKLAALVKKMDRKRLRKRPAPDRWSAAEVLAHLADAELVAAWRMRHILGLSGTDIQAFDQNVWAKMFNYGKQDPKASLELFRVVRQSNLALLKSLPKEALESYGMHQERGKETIAHIIRMYAGHDLNHLKQVERIAKGE